jgi:hypothetical protein
LAKKQGSCETSGVMLDLDPIPARKTMMAYGDQMQTHNNTFVTATFAILNSALWALSFWLKKINQKLLKKFYLTIILI